MFKFFIFPITALLLAVLVPNVPVVVLHPVEPTPVASSVSTSPFAKYQDGTLFYPEYYQGYLLFRSEDFSINIDQLFDYSLEGYSDFYIARDSEKKLDRLMVCDRTLDAWQGLSDGSITECWIKTVPQPDYGPGD